MATQKQTYERAGAARPVETNKSEALWWRYMRLSGVLLIPLAFGHLAIVHLINSVADINHEWVVTTRWSFIGWRIYDAFLLWFAGLHGYRGLLYVVNDYVHNDGLNRVFKVGATLLLLGILALGTIALVGTPFGGS
jgi:succinate dehydrogenase / fumarate reductase membrane anchor subunit